MMPFGSKLCKIIFTFERDKTFTIDTKYYGICHDYTYYCTYGHTVQNTANTYSGYK